MQKPFFSIVIPTLNEEKYIGGILADLTKQAGDFEVIVVDGNSSDKTRETVLGYKNKLPLHFFELDKKNAAAQRNFGAKSAGGIYLAFFDADVRLPGNYLSLVKRELQKIKAPILTSYAKPDSRNIYDRALAQTLNVLLDTSVLFEKQFVPGLNFIVLKAAFDLVGGFNPEIKYIDDWDLALRLGKAGYKLTVLKKPKAVWCLRRYRQEGRLKVLRKNAQAALHLITKGPVTREIYTYPMGGGWYKTVRKSNAKPQVFPHAEKYLRKIVNLIFK